METIGPLFDRKVQFLSMNQLYQISCCHPWEYECRCHSCLSPSSFASMFVDKPSANMCSILPGQREMFISQLRHDLLCHATLTQLILAEKALSQAADSPTSADGTPEKSSGEKSPNVYKTAIQSLCEHHVQQAEKFIEEKMTGAHQVSCVYLMSEGPIRDHVIAHIHKASDGNFSATSCVNGIMIRIEKI